MCAGRQQPDPAADPQAGAAAAPAGDAIKIGGGFALTGDESVLDLPAANGAKLAAKEINAAGGVLGKPIDFIVHDSQYKMDVTAQTAKQFVEEDKVIGVIGYTDTDSVLASGPTIQKAGIPFVTAGATSPKIPSQVGDMMFLAAFGDNVQAAAGAEFGLEKFGKTAYLLYDKGVEYTTLLGDYFKQAFTDLGGTVVLEDSYDDKATDFSAQIAKVKALPEQPAFYYVAAMPYNVGTVVKQFRDAGITGPDHRRRRLRRSVVDRGGRGGGQRCLLQHARAQRSHGRQRGLQEVLCGLQQGIWPRAENAFAALGYDSVYLFADALKRAGCDRRAGDQEGAWRRPRTSRASPARSASRRTSMCRRRV